MLLCDWHLYVLCLPDYHITDLSKLAPVSGNYCVMCNYSIVIKLIRVTDPFQEVNH